MSPKRNKISCSFELAAMSCGFPNVCGVDEAGRGPLAGPVTAAAVILKPGCDIRGINDSKKLSPATREKLFDKIKESALAWNIEFIDAATVDEMNILKASLLAMRRAVEGLGAEPGFLYVDGKFTVPGLAARLPQKALRSGDARCVSIAAASILAKVARDRYMIELHEKYPEYGFAKNKGYGTAEHILALGSMGPCPEHRRSFDPLRTSQLELFEQKGES